MSTDPTQAAEAAAKAAKEEAKKQSTTDPSGAGDVAEVVADGSLGAVIGGIGDALGGAAEAVGGILSIFDA